MMLVQPQTQFGNKDFNIKRVQSPTLHPPAGDGGGVIDDDDSHPHPHPHPRPHPDPDTDTDTDPEDYDESGGGNGCVVPPCKTISTASFNLRAYLKGAVLRPLINHCAPDHFCFGRNKSASDANASIAVDYFASDFAVGGVDAVRRFTKKSFRECIEFYHANGTVGPNTFPRFRTGIGAYKDASCLTLPALINEHIIPPEHPAPLQPCSCNIRLWLQSGPLKTAERALHLSHLYTTHWSFTLTRVPGIVANDFATFAWTFRKPDPAAVFREGAADPWIAELMGSEHKVQALMAQRGCGTGGGVVDGRVSVAVMVRQPWLLSLKDMENFMNCSHVPPFNPATPPSRMRRAHALWYAVKHVCQALDTQYFILTTYEGWLFGKFFNNDNSGAEDSSGMMTMQDRFEASLITGDNNNMPGVSDADTATRSYSGCAVSAVFKYRARSPSIMESLTYWIARSMGLKYTNSTPLVFYHRRSNRIDFPLHTTDYHPHLLLSLLTTAHPAIPFGTIILTVPRPRLPSGLHVPLTMAEERYLRCDERYMGDLRRCGMEWLSPRAVFMQFVVWLKGYYEYAAVQMYPELSV